MLAAHINSVFVSSALDTLILGLKIGVKEAIDFDAQVNITASWFRSRRACRMCLLIFEPDSPVGCPQLCEFATDGKLLIRQCPPI
jgi:hypothetical protein